MLILENWLIVVLSYTEHLLYKRPSWPFTHVIFTVWFFYVLNGGISKSPCQLLYQIHRVVSAFTLCCRGKNKIHINTTFNTVELMSHLLIIFSFYYSSGSIFFVTTVRTVHITQCHTQRKENFALCFIEQKQEFTFGIRALHCINSV